MFWPDKKKIHAGYFLNSQDGAEWKVYAELIFAKEGQVVTLSFSLSDLLICVAGSRGLTSALYGT